MLMAVNTSSTHQPVYQVMKPWMVLMVCVDCFYREQSVLVLMTTLSIVNNNNEIKEKHDYRNENLG